MAGPALVGLTIAGHTSAAIIRDFEKSRFITPKSWRVHGTLRSWVERGEAVCGPGALPLLGSRVACPGFHGFTLLTNVKHKSGSL